MKKLALILFPALLLGQTNTGLIFPAIAGYASDAAANAACTGGTCSVGKIYRRTSDASLRTVCSLAGTFVDVVACAAGPLAGNAATATALAANGANCSSGSAPLGVDASGATEGCFDVGTQTEVDAKVGGASSLGTVNHIPYVASSGNVAIDTTSGKQLFRDSSTGRLGIGTASPAGMSHVNAPTATEIGSVIQTTDANTTKFLSEWRDSDGSVMAGVLADGSLALGTPGVAAAGTYRLTLSGASKGTVYYGLNTSVLAAGDILNYAVGSNQVTGGVTGFNYSVKSSTAFASVLTNTDNASGTADSLFEMATTGASGGDPGYVLSIVGVLNVAFGLDNSDSDKYKLCPGNKPSNCTVNGLVMLTSGTDSGIVGFGTNDLDGTPAIGRIVAKGRTNDGTTNIFVGRDSDEVNVASLDTNGKLTINTQVFTSGAEPTCDSTTRGTLVLVQGGAAVADTFRICTKDAADAYAYRALF